MQSFTARVGVSVAFGLASWLFLPLPVPDPDAEPLLFIISVQSPILFGFLRAGTYVGPATVCFVLLMISDAVIRTFASALVGARTKGKLPPWPIKATDPSPSLVIGEKHHPTELKESPHPEWCVMPEKGLYTGLIIFGAIGTGKTSACMNPYARQLLSWQAPNKTKRCAALILEVKGDFCYDIQAMLREYKRFDDYMELSLDLETGWRWNPLNAPWIDTYSLAYTMASLVNQLFGKGKDPFWQQAYTSTMRWIIEIYRSFPEKWFTLADLYKAMVDRELLGNLVHRNERQTYDQYRYQVWISAGDYEDHRAALERIVVRREDIETAKTLPPPKEGETRYPPPAGALKAGQEEAAVDISWSQDRLRYFAEVGDVAYTAFCWAASARNVVFSNDCVAEPDPMELERTQGITTWYRKTWLTLDDKLRSSIVIGISVFLDLFISPEVSRVFCPPNPAGMSEEDRDKAHLMPRDAEDYRGRQRSSR